MLGEAENKANSASIEFEVEAELCNIRNKLSWECHTRGYNLSLTDIPLEAIMSNVKAGV